MPRPGRISAETAPCESIPRDRRDGSAAGIRSSPDGQPGWGAANANVTGPGAMTEVGQPFFVAGYLVGLYALALAAYLGGIALLARRRDPLRGRRDRPLPRPDPQRLTGEVVDVRAEATSARTSAAQRLRLQLAGLLVGSPVLVPFLWPSSVPYGCAGVAIGVGLPWLIRRRRGDKARTRIKWHLAERPLLAGAVFAVAAAFILVGLVTFLVWAVRVANPSPVDTPANRTIIYLVGIGAMAAGSGLWHFAQRLAAVRAKTLMRTDLRPPVLYLRSFGDDRLRIRAATYGRAAFVERLTPRRLAPFEQVIARHLADVGPVIAVNRPGTRLAPMGAARETLSDAEWQRAIDDLIERASWIVVCAAPQSIPRGFAWELGRLAGQRWRKTLFVLPPVPDSEMRERWEGFAAVLGQAAASAAFPLPPLPVDPADALATMVQPGGSWIAITSDRRDEWSYANALQAATERIETDEAPIGHGEPG